MPNAYNRSTNIRKRPTRLVSDFNIRKSWLQALDISLSVLRIQYYKSICKWHLVLQNKERGRRDGVPRLVLK